MLAKMHRSVRAFALSALLFASAGVPKPACPPREAGSAYPWQNFQPMRGDQQAVVYIDVDKTGQPIRCGMGKNNIPDPETRFRVCQSFISDWHAPAAGPADPPVRTIRRDFTMLGSDHQLADEKAREQWFKQHPDARPECYPTDY
jgi:hypothetical protein